jgi:hypothetical protein
VLLTLFPACLFPLGAIPRPPATLADIAEFLTREGNYSQSGGVGGHFMTHTVVWTPQISGLIVTFASRTTDTTYQSDTNASVLSTNVRTVTSAFGAYDLSTATTVTTAQPVPGWPVQTYVVILTTTGNLALIKQQETDDFAATVETHINRDSNSIGVPFTSRDAAVRFQTMVAEAFQ